MAKRKREYVMFPVPKDMVDKLIHLFSDGPHKCDGFGCSEVGLFSKCVGCKETIFLHSKKCRDKMTCRNCHKIFCNNCSRVLYCTNMLPNASNEGYRCSGSIRRCNECIASISSIICQDCKQRKER